MAGDRSSFTSMKNAEAAAPSEVAVRCPAIDLHAALARAGGSGELLGQAGAIFRDQAGELLAAIDGAISRMEGAGLNAAAHSLKGSLGFFEACRAAGLAAELERRGGAGIWEGTALLASCLRAEVARVTAELEELSGAPR